MTSPVVSVPGSPLGWQDGRLVWLIDRPACTYWTSHKTEAIFLALEAAGVASAVYLYRLWRH